jgi:low temperature requirement protein LtrA
MELTTAMPRGIYFAGMKASQRHSWLLVIGVCLILGSTLVPQQSTARLGVITAGLLCTGMSEAVRRYSK